MNRVYIVETSDGSSFGTFDKVCVIAKSINDAAKKALKDVREVSAKARVKSVTEHPDRFLA